MPYFYRTTLWQTDAGDIVQAAVGTLDSESWDLLSEVTEHRSGDESLVELLARLKLESENLADRQFAGQQRLL